MSYRTEFHGEFTVTPSLTAEECSILRKFSETRHEGDYYPSVWCEWVPTDDGSAIVAPEDDNSFYEFTPWLQYLIHHYLIPWGVSLSGEMSFQGEEPDDRDTIFAKDNEVRQVEDEIIKAKSPF